MFKSIIKAACFSLINIVALNAMAQTTTINYLSSGLSTSACNVFSPSVNVAGVSHSSHAGGVSFNATNGLQLTTDPNNSKGTAFIINYSFVSGYRYGISITQKGNSSLTMNTSVVTSLTSYATHSNSACSVDSYVSTYPLSGFAQYSNYASPSGTTNSIPSFDVTTSGYQYLIIWALYGNTSLSLDVLSISQVVITKTPLVSFTLPSTTNLTCGTSTPQTFTVTNVYSTGGVTDYTWNLGTTPNGWIYNGSPASASISTGTTNNITLTPDCGTVQSNVSATVTANGNTYSTNTNTVSISQPSMSISGSQTLCSSTGSYSISNLPCNATVAWSSSNTLYATISSSGNPATLTKLYNGAEVTLTANVTACSAVIPLTKVVYLGVPQINSSAQYTIIYYGPGDENEVCRNEGVIWDLEYPGATSVAWTYVSRVGGPLPTWYQTGDDVYIEFYNPSQQNLILNVEASNTCGSANYDIGFKPVDCGFRMEGVSKKEFKISPNPAFDMIAIGQASTSGEMKPISQVIVTDANNNLIISKKFDNVKMAQLNVNGFKPGIYYVKIISGKYSEVQTILKK